ncbi:hypothetical protein [Microbacterium gorillae]|uniref:hypothetical protein n=1 Tax=Microbacterium gorillae TaxID=1231063 RepID=UPI000590CFC9|nr:hypothetical protein [Microbacterium gorillae]
MTGTSTRPSSTALRWGRPWIWGTACLLIATPFFLSGRGMDFLPFVLVLIGGLLIGRSALAALGRIRPVRRGTVVHVVLAVTLVAGGVLGTRFGGWDSAASLPAPLGALVVMVLLAMMPAGAWIALAALGRVSVGTRAAAEAALPTPPAWERTRATVRVTVIALVLRMRTLVIVIVASAVGLGLVAVAVLIAFDRLVTAAGPRFAVVLVAIVLAAPLLGMLHLTVRRRSGPVTLTLEPAAIRVSGLGIDRFTRFRDLDELRWQAGGEYARVVVRDAGGPELSLFLGFAGARATAALPALPDHVRADLTAAGLVESVDRGGLVRFTRPRR